MIRIFYHKLNSDEYSFDKDSVYIDCIFKALRQSAAEISILLNMTITSEFLYLKHILVATFLFLFFF